MTLLQEHSVVIESVELKVIDQRLDLFCRAPGFSKQAIDVGSEHGTGMVETKKRVKANFFKLPLARHSSPLPLAGLVVGLWKEALNKWKVGGILIRLNAGILRHH